MNRKIDNYLKLILQTDNYGRPLSFKIEWVQPETGTDPEIRIEATLRHDTEDGKVLKLVFERVTDLQLDSTLNYYDGLGTIVVYDIRDRQWDQKSFKVVECEDEGFAFYCDTFNAYYEGSSDASI